VSVDDTFLFDPSINNLVDSNKQSLWAPILTKAWSKVKGTYDTPDSNLSLKDGLETLLGIPVSSF